MATMNSLAKPFALVTTTKTTNLFGAYNKYWRRCEFQQTVFADVGVTVLAVLNAMRALHVSEP